jgi:hypothetical protein
MPSFWQAILAIFARSSVLPWTVVTPSRNSSDALARKTKASRSSTSVPISVSRMTCRISCCLPREKRNQMYDKQNQVRDAGRCPRGAEGLWSVLRRFSHFIGDGKPLGTEIERRIGKIIERFAWLMVCFVALLGAAGSAFPQSIPISDSQAERIGRRLWQNESGGTIGGLTAWNVGEDFASLGIGHFIWYPAAKRGPFEESFPPLLQYLVSTGCPVPAWLKQGRACPWSDRWQFLADQQSPRMKELRSLLAETIAFQARFAALRLERALPKMLEALPSEDREKVRGNFYRVASEPQGLYALVDYVNFKGEGLLASERYRGQGWGLLQVLEEMGKGPPGTEFSRAADKVLTRRVANSPAERNEKRWLPGWRNRIRTYAE